MKHRNVLADRHKHTLNARYSSSVIKRYKTNTNNAHVTVHDKPFRFCFLNFCTQSQLKRTCLHRRHHHGTASFSYTRARALKYTVASNFNTSLCECVWVWVWQRRLVFISLFFFSLHFLQVLRFIVAFYPCARALVFNLLTHTHTQQSN